MSYAMPLALFCLLVLFALLFCRFLSGKGAEPRDPAGRAELLIRVKSSINGRTIRRLAKKVGASLEYHVEVPTSDLWITAAVLATPNHRLGQALDSIRRQFREDLFDVVELGHSLTPPGEVGQVIRRNLAVFGPDHLGLVGRFLAGIRASDRAANVANLKFWLQNRETGLQAHYLLIAQVDFSSATRELAACLHSFLRLGGEEYYVLDLDSGAYLARYDWPRGSERNGPDRTLEVPDQPTSRRARGGGKKRFVLSAWFDNRPGQLLDISRDLGKFEANVACADIRVATEGWMLGTFLLEVPDQFAEQFQRDYRLILNRYLPALLSTDSPQVVWPTSGKTYRVAIHEMDDPSDVPVTSLLRDVNANRVRLLDFSVRVEAAPHYVDFQRIEALVEEVDGAGRPEFVVEYARRERDQLWAPKSVESLAIEPREVNFNRVIEATRAGAEIAS